MLQKKKKKKRENDEEDTIEMECPCFLFVSIREANICVYCMQWDIRMDSCRIE